VNSESIVNISALREAKRGGYSHLVDTGGPQDDETQPAGSLTEVGDPNAQTLAGGVGGF